MKIILPCGVTAEEVMSKSLAARRIRSRPGRYVTVLAAAAMLSTTACATGTHGSGPRNGNLSTAVAGLEFVTADGKIITLSRQKDGDRFPAIGAISCEHFTS